MFFSSKESEKVCELSKRKFVISKDEIALYKSADLPLPDLHPEERHRRQLSFRNARRFYTRKCSATGEEILSVFDQSTTFPVVNNDYWWNGDWDPFSIGLEFTSQRPFFEQVLRLWDSIPRPATTALNSSNSEAVQHVSNVNDSYYLFDAHDVENSIYCVNIHNSQHCIDCYYISGSNNCYGCVDCHNSSNLHMSEHCGNCKDSWFLANCRDCSNCLFCTNLEGKSYHIFNKAYSKEDYEKELSKYNFQIRENIAVAKNIFSSFLQEHPIPHIYSDTPQSVSGNYLKACSNTHLSYECFKSANLFVTSAIINGARCADGYGFANKTKDAVQFVSVGGNAKNIANSYECWNNVSDLQYSAYCSDSSNLFACIGLKGAEYCIFNKQYSKKDYQKKIKEIVSYLKKKNIWGQFFPRSFSPFSYNKSLANEYMPLSNVQVGLMGYNQRSKTKSSLNIKVLNQEFSIVPSTLTNNLDDLCNKNFLCEISATPFSFVKKELELYQKLSIPPPARSFEQRHVERLAHLSPKRTFSYQCSRSEKSIKTSFPEKWRQPVVERNHWLHLVGINSE